jgi:hypothetical protein
VIPTHLLTCLQPGDRVAVLSRGGETRFLVHPATDSADAVRAAAGAGCEVLATHMHDPAAIEAYVASRERDVGGEG